MLKRSLFFTVIAATSLALSGCRGGPAANTGANTEVAHSDLPLVTTPKTSDVATNNAPTLTPVFKAYCDAWVRNDEAALRTVFSADTLKVFETAMNEQKAKNLIKFLEPTDRVSGNPCEVTNEQINGDRAVATVKSDRYPNGIEVAFVKENGDWKMTSRSPAVDSVKLAAPGNISAPPNSEPPVTLEQQPHVNIQALNLSKGPRRVRQLTIDTEGRGGPACIATTPKNKIVYCSKNGETGDLWIMDSDGRNQRQLTFDDPLETSAAVSPDGRQVAFGVAGQGIWKVDMDGGNRRQLTQYGMFPFYSKDGKWIYYTVQRERWSMWKVSSDGGEPIRVTDYPGVQPAVSPNGKLIAYMSGKSIAELKLYVAPVEGGAPLKIFDAPPLRLFDIGWSPDGKSIAYNVFDNGVFEIVGQPLDGGAPQVLISTNSASESFRSFAFSRDGKQLFYSTGPVN